METVDGVWGTELGVEESVNLFFIAQVGFSGNDVLGVFGGFRLDNVGQDKVDIGSSRVGQELVGELQSVHVKAQEGGDSRYLPTILRHR